MKNKTAKLKRRGAQSEKYTLKFRKNGKKKTVNLFNCDDTDVLWAMIDNDVKDAKLKLRSVRFYG